MEGGTGRDGTRGLVACVLTWLLPGAGHVYLGRAARGVAFFAIVAGMAVLGVVEKGNLSVVNETAPNLTKLQVGVNLALGPAEPLLRKSIYGGLVYDRRHPRGRIPAEVQRFLEKRKERGHHPASPYGTAYLWTAGLMNLLLLLDAWDLANGRKG